MRLGLYCSTDCIHCTRALLATVHHNYHERLGTRAYVPCMGFGQTFCGLGLDKVDCEQPRSNCPSGTWGEGENHDFNKSSLSPVGSHKSHYLAEP